MCEKGGLIFNALRNPENPFFFIQLTSKLVLEVRTVEGAKLLCGVERELRERAECQFPYAPYTSYEFMFKDFLLLVVLWRSDRAGGGVFMPKSSKRRLTGRCQERGGA